MNDPMKYEALTTEEIEAVLRKVPHAISRSMTPDVVLAGGVIRDTLAGLPVKDVDIFCHSEEQAQKMAAGLSTFVRHTTFAYSVVVDDVPIQFVYYKDFTTPEELIGQFDFRACCAGMYWTGRLWRGVAVEGFHEDCAGRALRFMSQKKDERKLSALRRAVNFSHKGWTISDAELAAILLHWRDIKPNGVLGELYENEHSRTVRAFRPAYGRV